MGNLTWLLLVLGTVEGLLWVPCLTLEQLKDKLRHITTSGVSLSKTQFKSGSTKPEVVRSAPLSGAEKKTFIKKR